MRLRTRVMRPAGASPFHLLRAATVAGVVALATLMTALLVLTELPPSGLGVGPAGAQSNAASELDVPGARVLIATKYLRAEATKADALERIALLRATRSEVEASAGTRAGSAVEAQLKRLEGRLAYHWLRWQRANRRSFQAKQAAGELNATPTPSPESAEAPTEPASDSDAGPTEAQWEQLRQCESSGNYQIISSNGLYYGAYQFSLGTWVSVGGSGSPADATAAEQDLRARILYEQRGAGPWPHCGRYL